MARQEADARPRSSSGSSSGNAAARVALVSSGDAGIFGMAALALRAAAALPDAELVAVAAAAGVDVLAITDHWVRTAEPSTKGLLVIPSTELNAVAGDAEDVRFFGKREPPDLAGDGECSPRIIASDHDHAHSGVRALRDRGGHPRTDRILQAGEAEQLVVLLLEALGDAGGDRRAHV